ncbi:MAG: hypothetical protein M1825_005843 [Sarcosagium campestre]|nr:MAG: hypothetical protein M1825_005843 [Sarcosagium campestre]
MEKFLREWRQDALNKHQYDAAIFVGDKLLAITNDDNDAFWLAQVHFSTGNYTRAQGFLSRQDLVARNVSCRYLSAHCLLKQLKYDEALTVLGDKNPTHLIRTFSNSRRKIQHPDANVDAAGQLKKNRSDKHPDRVDKEDVRDSMDPADIRFEAAMCYLRGICYAKQNAFDRAKDCYRDAVLIDVQCFEAFDQLMKNCLLSPDEEWKFLDSLDFDSIALRVDMPDAQEAAEFARMLYTTRLSKYKNPDAFATATETLSTHYNLSSNADLLLSRAELLFTQCRFREALALTESVLAVDRYNFSVYPLHLACLYELRQKNTLFLLAHDLADQHPHEPGSWLAVGVYYLCIGKVAEARRFFSKASMMDPHFGPAWIGFAHTFAAEGEHDQAISAYSTAARLFQGTHLPSMFLGMQNLQLNNMTLADEYLKSALALCRTDPLLYNELGVVFYHQGHMLPAIEMLDTALALLTEIADTADNRPSFAAAAASIHPSPANEDPADASAKIGVGIGNGIGSADVEDPRACTATTRANLAHVYRRMGMWDEALEQLDEVLRLCPRGARRHSSAAVFTTKALVLLEQRRPADALLALHNALAVSPQDPIATDLLAKALHESAGVGGVDGSGDTTAGYTGVEEEFELLLAHRREDAVASRAYRNDNGNNNDDGASTSTVAVAGKSRARDRERDRRSDMMDVSDGD